MSTSKSTDTFQTKIAVISCVLMFLSVFIGAFGAHGLEGKISEKAMATFKTGHLYHTIHALALLALSHFKINLKKECILFLLSIILFSGNCYLYALFGQKTFAMLVPFGGIGFLLAWAMILKSLYKAESL